jgi:hypothetical protein
MPQPIRSYLQLSAAIYIYFVDFGLADARGENLGVIFSHFASHHAPNATRPRQTVRR